MPGIGCILCVESPKLQKYLLECFPSWGSFPNFRSAEAIFAISIQLMYPRLNTYPYYYPYSWLGSLDLAVIFSLVLVRFMPKEKIEE
jgi:hypothetical protein